MRTCLLKDFVRLALSPSTKLRMILIRLTDLHLPVDITRPRSAHSKSKICIENGRILPAPDDRDGHEISNLSLKALESARVGLHCSLDFFGSNVSEEDWLVVRPKCCGQVRDFEVRRSTDGDGFVRSPTM
jgi:hypothetical protein